MANFFNTLFGIPNKNSKVGQVEIKDFQVDPYYTSSQKELDTLGTNILSGNLPDYYKNIGQANSPAFQQMLDSVIGKTNQGVNESLAASGTLRSGVAQSATSDALKSIVPQLTYADFLNAQGQQVGLLNTGIGLKQDVGNRAISQEGLLNNYNLAAQDQRLNQASYGDQYDMYRQSKVGQMYATMINTGIGALTGGMTGGMSGAASGAMGGFSGQSNSPMQFMDMMGSLNKTSGRPSTASPSGTGITDSLGSYADIAKMALPFLI